MKSGAHDCLEKDRAKGEELRRAVSYAIEKAGRRQVKAQGRKPVEKDRTLGTGLGEEEFRSLRTNEAQLRAILDNSNAVIFVKDLEGRYLRVNRWYEAMHGMSFELFVILASDEFRRLR
jgi:PAS domain-containing protein